MASVSVYRTRIKMCGLTRQQDVQHAAQLGVDAIGLVFYAPSPRAVTVEQATVLLKNIPPFMTVTALFVNPSTEEVNRVLASLPVGLLQFHGDESPEFCQQFSRPFIKAIAMKPDVSLMSLSQTWQFAQALLLDTYKPGVAGGTGEVFDWQLLQQPCDKPIILAGGLTPDNVSDAIRSVQPWAVDVSGGIERAKGIKDSQKMAQFVQQVAHTNKD